MKTGFHLGLGMGYEKALAYAESFKVETVQIFTHSPRMFKFKELIPEQQQILLDGWKRLGIDPVVSHASYLINIGSSKSQTFNGGIEILKNELIYGKAFGCKYIVYHVGKYTDTSLEVGVEQVVKGLQALESTLEKTGVMLLLEIASGQGSEFGKTFEELKMIFDKLPDSLQKHIGVCLDTCHMFAGGYDVGKPEPIVKEIEETIGLERIKVIHVNDSKFPLGANRDRHEHLGKGHIGIDKLKAFVTHPAFNKLPFILETPEVGHKEDLKILRSL